MKSQNQSRILIRSNVGELLCGDISKKKDGKFILFSKEIDIDPETEKFFNENDDLVFQLWQEGKFVKMATRIYGHKRLIQIETGLFDRFKLEIDKPARGGGLISLSIEDPNYRGLILHGSTLELDKRDFENRLEIIETQIIPKILDLFNAKIESKRIGDNA